MKTYTKESLIDALKEIRSRGWIENHRKGNVGGIGNTLEDLLGIEVTTQAIESKVRQNQDK